MARAILACSTLKQELNIVLERIGCNDPVIWLDAGDHNVPRRRRDAIEYALRTCSQYDTVVLAMSFCGGALAGLESHSQTLLLPCFDDCIGLLLPHRRRANAYYLTEGWLAGERNLLSEYRNSVSKYGQDRTKRIFDAMLRGYRSLIWLDCGESRQKEQARMAAAILGLEFEAQSADLSKLEDLLWEKDESYILRIPPQTTITLKMRQGMIPVTVAGRDQPLYSLPGEKLLNLLRRYGIGPDAPCGGMGSCGKCTVLIDGISQKSCSVSVTEPVHVTIPAGKKLNILHETALHSGLVSRPVAAVDIGTTSIVCSLLDGNTGKRVAVKACANPQRAWGADVLTRIRAALEGHMEVLTRQVRQAVSELLLSCCENAGVAPSSVERTAIVGNPAMEQMFLGISPANLIRIPFAPALTEANALPCRDYIPEFTNSELFIAPNISGYVGGDTLGCIVAEKLNSTDGLTLLVDIGTNGEMILSMGNRMVACATAAGPALEGAGIRFGMTASPGAIDHVWLENGEIRYHTIDNAAPLGICGSGLIDAVAVFLELGRINHRGRIEPGEEIDGQRILPVCDHIYLTQEDIRQMQLAKGAIAAGIRLMAKHFDAALDQIDTCLLSGAFGNRLNPDNACSIGLLPRELLGKVRCVGNAAARGAELMALDADRYHDSQSICGNVEIMELASLSDFPKAFAEAMRFR